MVIPYNLMSDKLEQLLKQSPSGDSRALCPLCAPLRKSRNRTIPTLSISKNSDKVLWNCHHCGEAGGSSMHKKSEETGGMERVIPWEIDKKYLKDINVSFLKETAEGYKQEKHNHLSEEALRFLETRRIDKNTIQELINNKTIGSLSDNNRTICFIYTDQDDPAFKIRSTDDKLFWSDGSPRSFWAPGKIDPKKDLYIVEGELDAISLYAAGFKNVVSVPNGAPSQPVKHGKAKFEYIEKAHNLLRETPRIILALDDDNPGEILKQEITKRIDRALWDVSWKKNINHAKDANDYLVKYGPDNLRDYINNNTNCKGIRTVASLREGIRKLYDGGRQRGASTGYPTLDRFYTVAHGQLCIVTGIPNRGKSSFLDQIMVNLSRAHNANFIICSMENDPEIHSTMLLEKYLRIPLKEMSVADLDEGQAWLDKHYTFLSDDLEPRVSSILDRAKDILRIKPSFGMVVDPFNYLSRDASTSEYVFINELLTEFRNFARQNNMHVWIVAHPRILREHRDDRGDYKVPQGYEISGSHAWFSKTDIGLTVDVPQDNISQIHVWKCRYSWIGQKGVATLSYNRSTGTYSELEFTI